MTQSTEKKSTRTSAAITCCYGKVGSANRYRPSTLLKRENLVTVIGPNGAGKTTLCPPIMGFTFQALFTLRQDFT